MWFVGLRLCYHTVCLVRFPSSVLKQVCCFVGPRLCQRNVCLKITRSTKQVTRNIIQSERGVIKSNSRENNDDLRNFLSSLYIINVKRGICRTCWGNEKCSQSFGDGDSVGAIETCYGPDSAGFETWWR
jgi:hypothetical protein